MSPHCGGCWPPSVSRSDRKSTRLNSSHGSISYAVFCLKKKNTTFTRQNGSLTKQNDFVAWMPNGRVYASENGFFAKTFGLNPADEPTIYAVFFYTDTAPAEIYTLSLHDALPI